MYKIYDTTIIVTLMRKGKTKDTSQKLKMLNVYRKWMTEKST